MGSALGNAANVNDRPDAGSPNQSRQFDLVCGTVPKCEESGTFVHRDVLCFVAFYRQPHAAR
jgi:hypothetical protein